MVISHKYKYVFIEAPWTGTTSISKVLVDVYDGEKVLFRHASYFDFLKIATEEEKKYFIFSSVRNPLDILVTNFFKFKTDHEGRYSDMKRTFNLENLLLRSRLKRFEFASKNNNFSDYFLKYYKWPYNSWTSPSYTFCDYVIRFENIDATYKEALNLIGIENPQPLPKKNITGSRTRDYISYYSPEAVIRAKKIFGPYMKKVGYDFPKEWGHQAATRYDLMLFGILNIFRTLYWKYMRYYLFRST